MSFIGIDLGTSFIKGAVLDLDALRLGHIQRAPFPDPLPGRPPLWVEIDPRAVAAAARQMLDSLLPHAPDCEGIVMCGQMQGLVLADERGEPLSNYISWKDQRALAPHPSGAGTTFDVLAGRITGDERRWMGGELRPSLPVSSLFWLAQNNQLPRDGAIPACVLDFVAANLCGHEAASEPTNACVHGVFNLLTQDWNWDVIARLGLGGLRWPAIRRAGTAAGYFKAGARRLPFYTPVGDQQCSLAGALLQEGELSLNISTGSQVSLLSPSLALGNYQTRPFFDGKTLNLITHIPAGRSLSALVSLLTEAAAPAARRATRGPPSCKRRSGRGRRTCA